MIEDEYEGYREAVISYVDILGFKDIIDRSTSDPQHVKKVSDLLAAVRDDLGYRPKGRRGGNTSFDFRAENFSDLTVRTRFISGSSTYKAAVQEIGYLARTQFELAVTEDVLIRGGICSGLIVSNSDVTFGPGLVKAYTLESEYAVYPRLVVDRDLVKLLLESDPDGQAAQLLRRGDDGAYFVDYLFSALQRCLWMDEHRDARRLASQHRDFILERIQKDLSTAHERVKQKLMWLALYHNSTLRRLTTDEISARNADRVADLNIAHEQLQF